MASSLGGAPVRARKTSSRDGRRIPRSSRAMHSCSKRRPASMSNEVPPFVARLNVCWSGFARGCPSLERSQQLGCSRHVLRVTDPSFENGAAHPVFQFEGGTACDYLAGIDHDDLVGEAFRLFHVLRREQDGRAGSDQLFNEEPEVVAGSRVQTSRGLVQEQHRRVGYQAGCRHRDGVACLPSSP